MAQYKLAQNKNLRSLIWGARGLRFGWVKVQYMSRLSTKNNNSRTTGSLRHFLLKMFCATLKNAPISVKSSIQVEIVLVLWQHFNFIIQTTTNSFRWRMLRCEVSTFLTVIPYFLFQSTRIGKRKMHTTWSISGSDCPMK